MTRREKKTLNQNVNQENAEMIKKNLAIAIHDLKNLSIKAKTRCLKLKRSKEMVACDERESQGEKCNYVEEKTQNKANFKSKKNKFSSKVFDYLKLLRNRVPRRF